MDQKYCYEYPRPAVTADCVVFGFDDAALTVLLIKRKYEPFLGCWAFPGGFVEIEEDIEQSAKRELLEETGLENIPVWQLQAFGKPGRDPRHRTISIAYYTLVKPSECKIKAGDDAADAQWFSLADIPELAFDHAEILRAAINRLQEQVEKDDWTEIGNKYSEPEFQTLRKICGNIRTNR